VTLIRLAEDETLQAVERVDASLDDDAGITEGESTVPADAEVLSGDDSGVRSLE
jgi:DNA gyrase subunit A